MKVFVVLSLISYLIAADSSGDLSQNILIEKMIDYLPQEVKGDINNDGMCNGLCSLWAYGMYLSDQPTTGKERDDHEFFVKARNLLLTRDLQSFDNEERSLANRFIQHVIFFQKWANNNLLQSKEQLDLENTLLDTKNRKVKKLLQLRFVCTEEVLKKRLKIITSTPGNMIFVGAYGANKAHITALYKKRNNEIVFYDPNSRSGEIVAQSVDNLMHSIWNATDQNKGKWGGTTTLEGMYFRDVCVYVYNFGDPCELDDLNLTIAEKESMLRAGNKILSNKFKTSIENAKVIPFGAEEYSEMLRKECSEINGDNELKQCISHLITFMKNDDVEKLKGILLSGLPIDKYSIADVLNFINLLPSDNKIAIIKLILNHRSNELMELQNVWKTSAFEACFREAIRTKDFKLAKFLLTEIPDIFKLTEQYVNDLVLKQLNYYYSDIYECLSIVDLMIDADKVKLGGVFLEAVVKALNGKIEKHIQYHFKPEWQEIYKAFQGVEELKSVVKALEQKININKSLH